MAKYICPVCDRPMEGKYYCSFCRTLVRNAYLSKVDYYLNESHPDTETHCDYHGKTEKTDTGKIRPGKSSLSDTAAKAVTKAVTQAAAKVPKSNAGMPELKLPQRGERPRQRHAATGNSNVVAAIIGIFILINILSSCLAF